MNTLKQVARCLPAAAVASHQQPMNGRRTFHDSMTFPAMHRMSGQGQAREARQPRPQMTQLTCADLEKVQRFAQGLSIHTLSEALGSRCMMRNDCAGSRESHAFHSAVREMVGHFKSAVSGPDGARGACMGLLVDGELAGICLLRERGGGSGVCRTSLLVIADAFQDVGLGPRLKAGLLFHAQQLGFARAEIVLDLSDMKGVSAAARGAPELPIVRLQRRASDITGFPLFGPEAWDADSMVMWFDLSRK